MLGEEGKTAAGEVVRLVGEKERRGPSGGGENVRVVSGDWSW